MFWTCKEKTIEYGERVLLMGIVNITPDSFSDGGDYASPETAVAHALQLLEEGADILDLGAQSTRPGYTEIPPEEEWARLAPVLTALRAKTNAPLSVDTYFPAVAEKALAAGADIINDVSGRVQPAMAKLVAATGCGWVLMHNGAGGTDEVRAFFDASSAASEALGVKAQQLCFDMGIGFGKTEEQNLELIANIPLYKKENAPLLLGVSRKRVIGSISRQQNPKERLYGNIAADTAAILGGADIIRLHDIKNEKQGIAAAGEIKKWIK